jgi:Cu2+-exporting ATPase
LPKVDESRVKVGYGITTVVHGETVRVGSRRFMDMENLPLPPELRREADRMLAEGNGCVFVAVGDRVAGALQLRASQRPEARELVEALRQRGLRHLAIVSGDHERPTRALAERLGMDRYFAEVLPQDKARCVAQLQREGRTVCFVGDGINDAPALRRADVSVSLRGASGVATDAAQVVFMEESLAKLRDLLDYSRGLERNVRRSWHLILAPNLLCVAGVFLAGFNLWHSMVLNNGAILLALGNGLLPLARNGERHPQGPNPA